jgi:hypothetical protein
MTSHINFNGRVSPTNCAENRLSSFTKEWRTVARVEAVSQQFKMLIGMNHDA